MKIFISYTTRDKIITRDFLSILEFELSDLGDIYIDLLHNHSKNKQARVANELQQADIFMLLSTDSIKNSPWVKWEIDTAKAIDLHGVTIHADASTNEFSIDEIRLTISGAIDKLVAARKAPPLRL
jgi:hypothetical protein